MNCYDVEFNYDISIVIPAYKANFLKLSLESIASQTDKRFIVYVGDDASKENLEEICNIYKSKFRIIYKKFETNLGSKSLVKHWERCVELSNSKWIWLFSDDDVMDKNCIECFYKTLESENCEYDIYRFDTLTIDSKSCLLKINPIHQDVETSVDFALHRFKRKRESFAVEYIFSRKVYDKYGGFVEFPLAWCSDDASWILFGQEKGIKKIPGGCVCWRKSEYNISSSQPEYRLSKLHSAFLYIEWFKLFVNNNKKNRISDTTISPDVLAGWYMSQLRSQAPYSLSDLYKIRKFTKGNLSFFKIIRALFYRQRKKL